jgi:general secretion pathway protein A
MYQAHWGLQESPFRGNLDPNSFYPSPTHEESLARLNFLAEQNHRVGLLFGPAGSGKSLLFEIFAQQLRRKGYSVAKLSLLDVEPGEFLSMLAYEWGLTVDRPHSTAALWRALTDRLIENRYQQLPTIVLLDDVDQANAAVLQHVSRLTRLEPSPEMRLTIVLAGRNEGMAKLGESLLGLSELRIELEPWQQTDTQQYVKTLLSQAGREKPVFAQRAVDRLHELAHGIPRRVSQLADLALLAGAGQNLEQIDAGVVEEAYQELGTIGS